MRVICFTLVSPPQQSAFDQTALVSVYIIVPKTLFWAHRHVFLPQPTSLPRSLINCAPFDPILSFPFIFTRNPPFTKMLFSARSCEFVAVRAVCSFSPVFFFYFLFLARFMTHLVRSSTQPAPKFCASMLIQMVRTLIGLLPPAPFLSIFPQGVFFAFAPPLPC